MHIVQECLTLTLLHYFALFEPVLYTFLTLTRYELRSGVFNRIFFTSYTLFWHEHCYYNNFTLYIYIYRRRNLSQMDRSQTFAIKPTNCERATVTLRVNKLQSQQRSIQMSRLIYTIHSAIRMHLTQILNTGK